MTTDRSNEKAMQLSRMKDDPKTNMAFVACVRRHPILYDYTMPLHSNRERQEEAWQCVAVESGDTVGNCKEKWKNLRASLCRHLRQQQAAGQGQQRPKKPYYLAEHMDFVVPFTKTRPTHGNILNGNPDAVFEPADFMEDVDAVIKQEDQDDDRQVQESKEHSENNANSSTDDEVLIQGSSSPWNDPGGDGPAILQVLEGTIQPNKKRKFSHSVSPSYRTNCQENLTEAADLNFLKSLLPDMAAMTARQKNSFKLAVLSAIERIVYSNAEESQISTKANPSNADTT